MRTTILAAIPVLAAASLLVAPGRASACGGPSPEPTVPFAIEQALRADEGVEAPPAAPVVLAARVERDDDPETSGCGGEAASKCGGGGSALVVELEPPADEGAGGAGGEPQIGWVFRVIEGEDPAHLPDGPVVPEFGGAAFAFGVGDAAVDVVLEITAVNRAGLASAPTRVHVQARAGDGDDEGGCAAAGGGAVGPSLLVLGWLALRRRR